LFVIIILTTTSLLLLLLLNIRGGVQVRFLEAQNRKLADELEKLKAKWGKETSQIKAMYQAELDEARRLLDEAEKDKARLEIRVASLEEQLEETRIK